MFWSHSSPVWSIRRSPFFMSPPGAGAEYLAGAGRLWMSSTGTCMPPWNVMMGWLIRVAVVHPRANRAAVA